MTGDTPGKSAPTTTPVVGVLLEQSSADGLNPSVPVSLQGECLVHGELIGDTRHPGLESADVDQCDSGGNFPITSQGELVLQLLPRESHSHAVLVSRQQAEVANTRKVGQIGRCTKDHDQVGETSFISERLLAIKDQDDRILADGSESYLTEGSGLRDGSGNDLPITHLG